MLRNVNCIVKDGGGIGLKQDLPRPKNCFCCGTDNPSGLKLSYYTDGKKVCASFVPDRNHGFSEGIVHSGVSMGALLEAMGWVVANSIKTTEVVLVEFNTKLFKPILIGHEYLISAEAVSINPWLSEISGTISDSENNMYIKATGKFISKSLEGEPISGHFV